MFCEDIVWGFKGEDIGKGDIVEVVVKLVGGSSLIVEDPIDGVFDEDNCVLDFVLIIWESEVVKDFVVGKVVLLLVLCVPLFSVVEMNDFSEELGRVLKLFDVDETFVVDVEVWDDDKVDIFEFDCMVVICDEESGDGDNFLVLSEFLFAGEEVVSEKVVVE